MSDRPPATPWGRFGKSLGWAWKGIVILLRTQANARIHLVATVLVIGAGSFCALTRVEWLFIAVAIGGVWVAEALNTALEAVVDLVSPQQHPLAGRAKDLAAGAVLLATFLAIAIGLLIFGPRLLNWIGW